MSRPQHAAMLLAALAAVALTGCTNDPAPKPAASPGAGSAPAPVPTVSTPTGTPPKHLKPPPPVAGELSRRVIVSKDGRPAGTTTLGGRARPGREYVVRAACASATPGRTLSVEVRSAEPGASADALTAFAVPCDGTPTDNSVGDILPAEPIAVYLLGDQSDVSSAYAVLAPVPSLPGGG